MRVVSTFTICALVKFFLKGVFAAWVGSSSCRSSSDGDGGDDGGGYRRVNR